MLAAIHALRRIRNADNMMHACCTQAVKIHLESRLGISDAEAVEFVTKLDLDGDGKGWSVSRFDINRLV